MRLFVVVYNPLHTVVFIKAVRYICIETFVHKISILFELYGRYYNVLPEAIFVVYIQKKFRRPTCNEYLSSCKISSSVLFNKIKRKKKKKETENMKNMFRCIFQTLCQNTFIFREFILLCMF